MKKLIITLTALASLTIASTHVYAQAKLGNTADQFIIDTEYKLVSIDGPMQHFESDYLCVLAFFDANGICQNIDYIKKDGKPFGRPSINMADDANLDKKTRVKNKWKVQHKQDATSDEYYYSSDRYLIIHGLVKIGNAWYYHRNFTTQAGIEIATNWAKQPSEQSADNSGDVTKATL